ncbi:F-box only protein 7 [Armadillidium vulgare]|nr:F-box only protein 7 [Armadillidium vulgare]
MIEAGFALGDPSESSRSLPTCWRDMVSTIKYHHSGFPSFVCTLVIVTMGAIKQVLVSFPGQESEISVKLETKEYVPSDIDPSKLEKLSTLARIFRNQLLYPLQVAAHQILGLPAPWHLTGLPQELLIKIASHLNLKSILNLSVTCKRLHSSVQDNQVWYNIFKRDFSDQYHHSDKVSGSDWKAKYKSAYERKKEREKRGKPYVGLEEPFPENPSPYYPNPRVPDPHNPFMPQPRAPDPYPPLPDDIPQPNPYWDPDSPYFGGEIPPPRRPFPGQPDPFDPFGTRPRRPQNPLDLPLCHNSQAFQECREEDPDLISFE